MSTPSTVIASFSTSSTPFILHQDLGNTSDEHSPWLNSSNLSPAKSSSLGMSCFTMTFGAVSNITALLILTRSRVRSRRESKAAFLFLAVALLLADLAGHVILGAFALHLHVNQRFKANKEFCQIFGASMVFFGLCPLLLGCAMAVERCIAIVLPFFYAATITLAHVQKVVILLSSVAFLLAVLPIFAVGTYTTQSPGTWCFLPIRSPQSTADTNLVLAFSCLGLTALTLSLICNIISGLALLWARIKSHNTKTNAAAWRTRRPSAASYKSLFFSLDVEMMVQLAVITVVSCVCWSPFLIHILLVQFNQRPRDSINDKDGFLLLSLRMASWNQILDPWVYILLRRTLLFKVCCAFYTQRHPVKESFILQ